MLSAKSALQAGKEAAAATGLMVASDIAVRRSGINPLRLGAFAASSFSASFLQENLKAAVPLKFQGVVDTLGEPVIAGAAFAALTTILIPRLLGVYPDQSLLYAFLNAVACHAGGNYIAGDVLSSVQTIVNV